MIFKVKSKIIFNGTVYERGDLIDLPEGSDTRDLFLNKLERVSSLVDVVEDADEDYVLEGTDDEIVEDVEPVEDDEPVNVVEIQANFTKPKPKKAKKK